MIGKRAFHKDERWRDLFRAEFLLYVRANGFRPREYANLNGTEKDLLWEMFAADSPEAGGR